MKLISIFHFSLFLIGSTVLHARLINVNFEQFSPTDGTFAVESELKGPAGGLGTKWNQLKREAANNATSDPLVDSTGATTTITITTDFTECRSNGSTRTPILKSCATDFGKGASRTVKIAGLQPGEIYDIWATALRLGQEPLVATWSTENPVSINPVQILDNRLFGNNFDFEVGGNYIVFRAVEADASGKIILNIQGATQADGFDSDYRAGLCGIQISPGTPFEPLEITDLSYSSTTNQIDVTWKSNPGESYGVYFSKNLKDFTQVPPAVIPAHASDARTSLTAIATPFLNSGSLSLRIGPPDLVDPKLERIWTSGSELTLVFSEQISESLATDPANFTLVDGSAANVPIASVGYGLSRTDIVLTPDSPLASGTSYTVTMNNLTDNAGRALSGSNTATIGTFVNNPDGVKVFILAGQSNMVGRGESERGAGGVNGAIGSLRHMVDTDPTNYGHLVDGSQNWATRADVKIKWGDSKGDLRVGFDNNRAQFGPELGAGQVLGDHYDEPVLLIKTAWGGKSLETDFRSPRAVASRGGEIGLYYLEMINAVRDALDDFDSEFPTLAAQGYQIAGFGWHQGINDVFDAKSSGSYEANMVDFIRSVREEFGQPGLPFSIATTSHERIPMPQFQIDVINAQLAVANPTKYPEFAGNVFTTDTAPFQRAPSVSPDNDWTHWNDNGETLYLIGKAIGDGLVRMISSP